MTIEFKSLAFGSKMLPGKDVKFGRMDASTRPSVEIRISPLVPMFVLSDRPKTGDHE
jgi:hypothetical protein